MVFKIQIFKEHGLFFPLRADVEFHQEWREISSSINTKWCSETAVGLTEICNSPLDTCYIYSGSAFTAIATRT